MKKALIALLFIATFFQPFAQTTFPVNGTHDQREGKYAFINSTIYKDYQTKLENATLIINDGKVEAIGQNLNIPKGTIIKDLKGKFIYPSFIELDSDYGISPKKQNRSKGRHAQQQISKIDGAYNWNEAITPEFNAHNEFTVNDGAAKKLRTIGFGAVLAHRKDGIARGTGVVATLSNKNEHEVVVKEIASSHLSFNKGTSPQAYPGSLMGAIALIKQTQYDADWYAKTHEETNLSLEAWNNNKKLPQIFETRDRLEVLRADKLGDELGVQYVFKTNGDDYQRVEAIKSTNGKLIIPIDFPKAYDVHDPYDAMSVDLSQLKHWEMAPANPAILEKNGIDFAITAKNMSSKDFLGNLRKANLCGLSRLQALKSLTKIPADIAGVSDQLGSLEKGKIANFFVSTLDIFEPEALIAENWVNGEQYVITEKADADLRGTYDLLVDSRKYKFVIGGGLEKPKFNIMLEDSSKIKVDAKIMSNLITLNYKESKKDTLQTRLSGTIGESKLEGKGQAVDGSWISWNAVKVSDEFDEKKKKNKDKEPNYGEVTYPFLPYGWTSKPEAQTVLFKNATVWTNEEDGILESTDVLIKNGKISKVGKGLSAEGGITVDATGKHITCGIIDEHSHIAISRGVNECTQAVTAEVSIGDVINSEDINIYRQLSGGVVASQLLHGSCNPVGGRSGIIKLRWGFTPEEMKIKDADGFIKFALGENVKRSNFGDHAVERFPQTRMGVEQVYMDAFTRAREYEQEWTSYNKMSKKDKAKKGAPRRDLELEVLLEIINSKRFVSCHSYVQSEINMLMKIAEQFDFRINTFTHILEGYKVADKMKAHGVAGSTFSDWWAYKYEVIDAIPYNGAIMHEQGVLTGFNSDDAEMGRRLNQEAAKAVKYGGVSEEEAWKFVTLNPAKMLHLDDHMGSIKVGKDADIVLWSDHPLSIYAKAEQTYIDGMKLFDRAEDLEKRKQIQEERNRIVQKMLLAIENGEPTQKPKKKKEKLYHCDDGEDEICGTCE